MTGVNPSVSLVFFDPNCCLALTALRTSPKVFHLLPFPLLQVPVGNESQQVVQQQQYQQQVMVPVSQSVQGPMPVYYSVITPTQQSSTRYV